MNKELTVAGRELAEEVLIRERDFNAAVLNAVSSLVVVFDLEGRIVLFNRGCEECTGYTLGEVAGKPFWDLLLVPEEKEPVMNLWRELATSSLPCRFENYWVTKNGDRRLIEWHNAPLKKTDGSLEFIMSTGIDITRRKEAEEKQKRSEMLLIEAQRIAHIGNWELDLVRNVLEWSDEIYRIFEIDQSQFGASYEAFLKVIHPDDRAAVNAAYTSSVRNRQPYAIDHRLLFPDGRVKYVREQCETCYDREGNPLRSVGTVQDITEGKLAEEALKALSQRYEMILNSAGEGIYGIDLDGNILFVNPAAAKMLGYGVDEMLGRQSHSLFHHTKADGKPYPAGECPLYKAIKEGVPHQGKEEVFWTKNGSMISVEHVNTPLVEKGSVVGAVVVFKDVTESKKAEKALRLAGAYNRSLIEASLDPLVTIGPDGRITDVNRASEEVTGCARDELIGRNFSGYFTEPQKAETVYQKVFQSGRVRDYPLEIKHRDGHSTPVLYNAAVYCDENDAVIGIIAAARDMTDLKRAEQELERERAFFETAINATQAISYLFDDQLRFLRWNKNLELITEYTTEEIAKMSALDFFLDDEKGYIAESIQKAVKSGFTNPEAHLRCKDGRTIPFYFPCSRVDLQGKMYLVGIGIDITDRILAEDEIRKLNAELEQRVKDRTAQLEAANKELEAFSYSVSHDLRAPLRSIVGFGELLRKRAAGNLDEKSLHYLDVVTASTGQMGKLIDDLLAFSRMGRAEMTKKKVDLEQLIGECREELQIDEQQGRILWKMSSLPEVFGDPAMLKLVLVNLLSNAVKFTRTRDQAIIEIGSISDTPQEWVIYVRDNGVGFDMRYENKLFGLFQRLHRQEEFEGVGVGLANVRRIIMRHGGRVWAEGTVEGGATFYIALPKRTRDDP